MVRELADLMATGSHAREPLILNCTNPGLCHSQLAQENNGIAAIVFTIMKFLLARTTEVGSRTIVDSAAAGKESHGQYMSDCEITEPSVFVRSEEGKKTQEKVYTECIATLEKIQPGISKNI